MIAVLDNGQAVKHQKPNSIQEDDTGTTQETQYPRGGKQSTQKRDTQTIEGVLGETKPQSRQLYKDYPDKCK